MVQEQYKNHVLRNFSSRGQQVYEYFGHISFGFIWFYLVLFVLSRDRKNTRSKRSGSAVAAVAVGLAYGMMIAYVLLLWTSLPPLSLLSLPSPYPSDRKSISSHELVPQFNPRC